ncbi:MAG: D-alanyl-D-alanine carboxypeptidase DacF precursor [Firmicutes bacterium ADurb.Bin506]|jgi:D-alanyl-D-alanine carboxypeptidase (penicillin-binding protein 5/6)|nr:MAG: D-alanyl-D-alanine carboxypeptidase DacF precursor [Firmicutes bacterium ADurb.Bin506]
MRSMLVRVKAIAVAFAAMAALVAMLFTGGGVRVVAQARPPVDFAGMPVDPPPQLAARSAIIAEAETGQILYQMNADERMAPASITKIMTMLLVMERVDAGTISLDDKVTVSRAASQMGGSQVYLKEKEIATVGDLLAATAIRSANDASYALAEYVAGTDYDFVSLMNARARELGMTGTHFSNPEGLDDANHYTTARDILTMSRELVRHPKVLEWTSTWIGSMRNGTYELFNTNRLIHDYPGADGLKTGHTEKAGYCLAGTAIRNGVRMISVVLGTASEAARTTETAKLLDYGFRSFEKVQLAEEGSEVGTVKVPTAATMDVPVRAERNLIAMVPRGSADQVRLEVRPVSPAPTAPVSEGQLLGTVAAVGPNGEDIAAVGIVAAKDARRANVFVRAFRAIANFFRGLFGRGKSR